MTNCYCVYKHSCPNDKVYIGITKQNPIKRWCGGLGYSDNKHFFNAILKYGWDNIQHEIVFSNLTKEEACKKEQELIAQYKSNNPEFGYNLTSGGESGWAGRVLTEETRKKMSEAGKKKVFSDEHRKHLSENHRRYITETQRLRIIESNKTRIYSEETRKKMSKSHERRIRCVETGEIFKSIKLAAEKHNIKTGSIGKACRNPNKTSKGYHWQYWDDLSE